LQCVAVCFSVLQCVAVCCSVLQVCCSVSRESTFKEHLHATHMSDSSLTCACVISHMWICHVCHLRALATTCMSQYECVMSHVWMSYVSHMNTSVSHMNNFCHTHNAEGERCRHLACHTYECVMSHVWMHHVSHTNDFCNTYKCRRRALATQCKSHCVMSPIWMHHVSHNERVMFHVWKTSITHIIQKARAGDALPCMAHTWMSHVSRMKSPHLTCVISHNMSHMSRSHVSYMN